jgi:hypothetical protein
VLSTFADILRYTLIVIGVMTVLLIIVIMMIANMRAESPLKRVLKALSYRMGATIAAGVLAIPIEPIPGLDVMYDIGAPALLLLYWLSLFKNTGRTISYPPPRQINKP